MQIPDMRQLEDTYRQMTDEEILKLAEDRDSLTDGSKETLKAELLRRHLEKATSSPTPVPTEPVGLETPELRRLAETYRRMTDTEILRLASEMDTLADEAADALYTEVRRRNLEEAVAGEGREIPLPDETKDWFLLRTTIRYATPDFGCASVLW